MKYLIIKNNHPIYGISESVCIGDLEEPTTSFPAVVGNPNYDQFLVSAKLTDEEVHALEPDVWFDFPEETN